MIEKRAIRQVAADVHAGLAARGLTIDRLSHAQQFRLADQLGVPITDLRRELERVEQRASYPRGATVSVSSRDGSVKVQKPARKPDVVRSLADRHDEDLELRRNCPETVKAIDEISEQLGLDTSKSPSLRRAYIDTKISEWRKAGEHDHSEDGDRQWKLYRRYSGKLQRALHADIQASSARDIAVASLRRQAQATAAASRMGAR